MAGQTFPHRPQLLLSLSSRMHALPQAVAPSGHEAPQTPRSHVAVPPVGATQGVHDAPQDSGDESWTHAPAQLCVPGAQFDPSLEAPSETTRSAPMASMSASVASMRASISLPSLSDAGRSVVGFTSASMIASIHVALSKGTHMHAPSAPVVGSQFRTPILPSMHRQVPVTSIPH